MAATVPTGSITDVPGVTVGHYTDAEHATGCTVVLCDPPATAGIDVRGGAPGSRDTELLHPLATFARVNGFVLTGGSVFGLPAADGATRFLAERGVGLTFGGKTIPLVPAAVIFDLGMVTSRAAPTAEHGYQACRAAAVEVAQGSVGVGTGAGVGGLRGPRRRTKGGVGSASLDLGGGLIVGALVVTNPVGGIVDPGTGEIVAGPRSNGGRPAFEDSERILIEEPPASVPNGQNTVIGVVATTAALDKRGACRIAAAGQNGIARAVRPAHTSNDGDTIFALATGAAGAASEDRLRAAATRAVEAAIISAVRHATGIGGTPSAAEYLGSG